MHNLLLFDMLSPIAYLTCELKGRDLDSRFLIAAHLAKLGYHSVVGNYWGLVTSALVAPKGCYLFKTTNHLQAASMANCAALGHKVVAADEEAIAQNEAFAHMTTDPKAVVHCNLFLAISKEHKRSILKAFPAVRGKISTVGSARFDILRTAKTERPRPGPYILINTIFGLINGTWGDQNTAIDVYCRAMKMDMNDPAARRQVEDRIAYEKAALTEIEALIARLLGIATVDIVVRPHPSERSEFWQEKYAGAQRVTVVGRSDFVPWGQHAKLVVHCDSTTGIEAALMGTPCINLSADPAWAERLIIPQANYTVRSADEAARAVEAFLAMGQLPSAPRAANDLFPVNGAMKTARKIAGLLPKPRPLSELNWNRIEYTDVQRDKFTVSLDEAKASMHRMFALAGVRPATLWALDESAFLVSPGA